jgi:hypothetical protein
MGGANPKVMNGVTHAKETAYGNHDQVVRDNRRL